MLSYIILGMLSYGSGLSGYELKKMIENGVGVFYKASYGSLYPALRRLEKDGNITMQEDATGNRKKKTYSITEYGLKAFGNWLEMPLDISDSSNNHLAKIYFFDKLPQKNRVQRLAEYEMNQVQYLRKLETLREHFSQRDDIEQHYFKMSTLYYGLALTKETLRWCRHIKEEKELSNLFEKDNER